MQRRTILWLVSWYPNKYDPFDGDFIQRHAKAAALHHTIHVLFIKQHPHQTKTESSYKEEDGLLEQIIYLPKEAGIAGKLKNIKAWYGLQKREVEKIISSSRPYLIHVHIPWKPGLIALWAKKKFNVPYMVTEHWGIYNRVVEDNIFTRSIFFKQALKRIYKGADAFISVSSFLAQGVNRALVIKPYTVIPNVVETTLFMPSDQKHARFTFLHVSNMVALKNVEGIIEAFRDFLGQVAADAQLILVGNRDDEYVKMAERLSLSNTPVFFKGEMTHADVATEMKLSHAFLLNSDIENSPCVIGEALCCGLPVIATKVGGIPELVNESNGILIEPRNTKALTKAMVKVYENYSGFSTATIAKQAAQKFGLPVIAAAFLNLYAGNKP